MFKLKLFIKSFLFAVRQLTNPVAYWKGIWYGSKGVVKFKNGLELSFDSPGSLGLLYAIVGQQIYGYDIADKVIVDVGANRGYFANWAISMGAKEVWAFEPVKSTFKKLHANVIRQNKNQGCIQIFNKAVESTARENIKIYYNEGLEDYSLHFVDDTTEQYELVNSTSLREVVKAVGNKDIDILKLNCEGAEYDILLNSPMEVFNQINSIRLEYHNFNHEGKSYDVSMVYDRLSKLGFTHIKEVVMRATHGILIFSKI